MADLKTDLAELIAAADNAREAMCQDRLYVQTHARLSAALARGDELLAAVERCERYELALYKIAARRIVATGVPSIPDLSAEDANRAAYAAIDAARVVAGNGGGDGG